MFKKTLIILFLLFNIVVGAREITIENFENEDLYLTSYIGEDNEPFSWQLDTENTVNETSLQSLKIYGNCWKIKNIEPMLLNLGDVWQISCFVEDKGEIHAIGFGDGENELFYSLDGTELLNMDEWITVNQGAFSENEWNNIELPIASDWLAWFDEFPQITQIIFVNDNDNSDGVVYFDNLIDITGDLPINPEVEISYSIGEIYRNVNGERSVEVQFDCDIMDPDSDEHSFYWNFGNNEISEIQNPNHTFLIEDDHTYTVHLQVSDESNYHGYDSCQIEVDEGETSFPLTMNFVGDIMLGRYYESAGGIIPTQGVEAIFEPTLSILGDAADITVANLECPLTTHSTHHPTKTIYFKGAPENVDGLTYAGIDLVCLANNHVIDYMAEGMNETKAVLDEAGILHSGAGMNSREAYEPLFYSQKGVNLAFLRSSDRTGQYNNYQPYLNAGHNKFGFAYMTPFYVSQQLAAMESIADLKIVETHSGSEYSTEPGSNYDYFSTFENWNEIDFAEDEDFTPRIDIPHMWDIEIRHFFIDNGADIVICHHPHVIQGLEIYNGKLIAHSLGNFAFDLSYFETFPSMILNTKINETGFYEYSVKPVFIDDYIPQTAIGKLGNHILDYIAMKSRNLQTILSVDRENHEAFVVVDSENALEEIVQYEENLTFSQNGDYYLSNVIKLPKNGSISSIENISNGNDFEYRVGRELVWFGNFEDEGASTWNVNSNHEWIDEIEFFDGEKSLCIQNNSDYWDNYMTNLENRIKKISNNSYSVHGAVKTQNGSGVTVEIRFYQSRSGGTLLGSENLQIVEGNTDWTEYFAEIEVPDNAYYFDVVATSNPPENNESFAWFDDVGLIQWENWQTYFGVSSEVINPNDYYYVQVKSNEPIEDAIITFNETNYFENPSNIDDYELEINHFGLKNFPNPFSSKTTINFSLIAENTKNVEISIYNIKGQKVKTFSSQQINNSANRQIIWNAEKFASGIYLYQLKIDGKAVATKKCLLLK